MSPSHRSPPLPHHSPPSRALFRSRESAVSPAGPTSALEWNAQAAASELAAKLAVAETRLAEVTAEQKVLTLKAEKLEGERLADEGASVDGGYQSGGDAMAVQHLRRLREKMAAAERAEKDLRVARSKATDAATTAGSGDLKGCAHARFPRSQPSHTTSGLVDFRVISGIADISSFPYLLPPNKGLLRGIHT